MRSFVPFLRALCIALLLPATVMAAAQTDHGPARHDCCEGGPAASHHADAAPQTADPARDGHGEPSHEALHFSCGIYPCNWIEGAEPVAAGPHGLTWALYAPSVAPIPPAARAECLHRPPAALS